MHKTKIVAFIFVGFILLSQLTYGMQEKPKVIVEINPNPELFAVVYSVKASPFRAGRRSDVVVILYASF